MIEDASPEGYILIPLDKDSHTSATIIYRQRLGQILNIYTAALKRLDTHLVEHRFTLKLAFFSSICHLFL